MMREYRHMMEQAALSDEKKEEILTMLDNQDMKKRRRPSVKVMVLAAVLVALALSCTAMASGVVAETFGLWLGDRRVELDELTPVAFDLEGYLTQYPTGIVDGDRVFQSADSFTRATGMTLPGAEKLRFSGILLAISKTWRTGHLAMTVGAESGEAHLNGMFLLEGHTQEAWGYGVERARADEVYEYAEGRRAYFIKGKGEYRTQVYFVEGGVMFQMFVEPSPAGEALAKQIVDCMADQDVLH